MFHIETIFFVIVNTREYLILHLFYVRSTLKKPFQNVTLKSDADRLDKGNIRGTICVNRTSPRPQLCAFLPVTRSLHSELTNNSEYYFISKSSVKNHEIQFSQATDYFTVFLSL
jgi:hypothetical protein